MNFGRGGPSEGQGNSDEMVKTLLGFDKNGASAGAVLCSVFLLALCLNGETVTTQPFAGVTHISRQEVTPRKVNIHVVKIDLATPGLSFKLTPPGGSRETVRQTTLDFLKQEKAQIAVNGHLH